MGAFADALSEITGGSTAAAPEIEPSQAQAAPAESGFEATLAQIQESSPAPAIEAPEPGGGMEL